MRPSFRHALLLVAVPPILAAAPAAAQERTGPSRFDVGVYGGAVWTGSWLEVRDVDFSIGTNPAVGTVATYWPARKVGIRAHAGYVPAPLPQADGTELTSIDDDRVLNLWLYDLSLAFRPWAPAATEVGGPLSGAHLYAGIGGVTVDPAGDGGCIFPYSISDACLTRDPTRELQFTAGVSTGVIRVAGPVGVFFDAGAHVYDSPFTRGAPDFDPDDVCDVECIGDSNTGISVRGVVGLALAFGAPRIAPPPPTPPTPPPPTPQPEPTPVRLCVQVDGIPRYVDGWVRPETGDTVVVDGSVRRPLRAVYPAAAPFADERGWFAADQVLVPSAGAWYTAEEQAVVSTPGRWERVDEGRIERRDRTGLFYKRFGLPRQLPPERLRRVGEIDGVPILVDTAEDADQPRELLVPVRNECQVQPFRAFIEARG